MAERLSAGDEHPIRQRKRLQGGRLRRQVRLRAVHGNLRNTIAYTGTLLSDMSGTNASNNLQWYRRQVDASLRRVER